VALRLLARQFEATLSCYSSAPLEAQLLALLVIEIEISIFLVFKCAGALKSCRDEFAIAGKERAAQRSDDVPNGRKLAMDLLFPRSAKS
jgi:hypothetical protein